MLTPEQAAASKLLDLLFEWVESCDLWEKHNGKAANSGFLSLAVEREEHQRLQKTYTMPLMQRCHDNKINYVDLMQMIPPAFRTTGVERKAMFHAFATWATKEYEFVWDFEQGRLVYGI